MSESNEAEVVQESGNTSSNDVASQESETQSNEVQNSNTETQETQDSEWYWADGVKAIGDKPEWFMADKYKSISEQAKAYPELLKKASSFAGAPDDYSTENLSEELKNSEMLSFLKEPLKELNLSQQGFEQLTKAYVEGLSKYDEALQQKIQKDLSEDDAIAVTNVEKWLQSSFDDDTSKTIKNWITSVDDYKVLEKIKALIPSTAAIPGNPGDYGVSYETAKDLKAEMVKNKAQYDSDPNYKRKWTERFRAAMLREKSK